MKWFSLGCAALLTACVNSAPLDNPSAPGEIRPASEERTEARQLEQAEADCARQGKHAVARHEEGLMVYDCVSSD
jgi:hypothetical protein